MRSAQEMAREWIEDGRDPEYFATLSPESRVRVFAMLIERSRAEGAEAERARGPQFLPAEPVNVPDVPALCSHVRTWPVRWCFDGEEGNDGEMCRDCGAWHTEWCVTWSEWRTELEEDEHVEPLPPHPLALAWAPRCDGCSVLWRVEDPGAEETAEGRMCGNCAKAGVETGI